MVSSNAELLRPAIETRDYTTIAVGHIDDHVAAYALSKPVRDKIIARSVAITGSNIDLIEAFVKEYRQCLSWIRPNGGCVAFVLVTRNGVPVDDKLFCEDLLKKTGVLLVAAGHTFGTEAEEDFKGYLRLGLVYDPSVTKAVLGTLGEGY